MKFEIKNRWSGETKLTLEGETLKSALEAHVRKCFAEGIDADLSGSDLSGSNLSGSDLSGSNLSGSNLSGSNLIGSNLSGSNLSGSNLIGSNLRALLHVPNIDAEILKKIEAGGTTHCRGGWAIVIAGPAAQAVEAFFGSNVAAAFVYTASGEKVPDFFASNEDALADIKACAARQLAKMLA